VRLGFTEIVAGVTTEVDVAEVEAWAAGLAEVHARIAPRFARSEPRERVLAYVRGLLAPMEKKNSWTLAERAGEAIPDGMQRLLATADWDADEVRDDVRDYVVEHLGDPAGVLVVDETGFLKKGTKSAGVARQYSGTAGRIENCQIGVFLGYATPAGRTFLDRELYLPKTWAEDRQRRAEARVDEDVEFATKPELAMRMLDRALDAGVPAGWVTGDEVYGQHGRLRMMLEERQMPYVLAVPVNQRVIATVAGKVTELRADALAAQLPAQAWKKISAGAGAKGPRQYRRARAAIRPLEDTRSYWLLVRRSLTDPDDLAYYLCHGPERTPLRELVRVAGARWAIEETFQTGKGQVGLDQYQVRRYDSWYRHITLAMLAHAFLTVTTAEAGPKRGLPARSRS
jgi:SRSO17 transposase